jgi:hypothetical protein
MSDQKWSAKQSGRIGGLKAARKMTPEQRKERARKAANARWQSRKETKIETDSAAVSK